MSDLTAIGAGGADSSGVAAVQARIAQIQSLFGGSTPSFSSALASASTDTSASTSSSTSDGTDAASMASSLGLDPSVVSALAGATGSSGTSATTGTAATAGTSAVGATGGTKASQVIAEARKYLGVKYVWGGESPTGFDCSGLVQYVYKKFGVNLPRVSQDQAHAGKAVSAADAKAGDLVFYHNPATHVGIYLGNGMMLDAPNSKSVVRVEKLWSGVSGFRRVLPDSAFTAPAAAVRTAGSTGAAAAGGSVGALAAKLPAAGKQYASAIVSAANKNGVPPALLAAVVWQESNFNARAVSPAGAKGLVQLMPATARGLGVDPMNPTQALDGGARYLKQQLNTFGGRTDLALAAYNAGPSAVRRYGGVPPYKETQHYVSVIENKMSALSKAA